MGYSAVARKNRSAKRKTSVAPVEPGRFELYDIARPRRFLFLCLAYLAFGFAYITYATFIVASLEARRASPHTTANIALLWGMYGAASFTGALATAWLLQSKLRRMAMAIAGFTGAAGCFITFELPHVAAFGAILVGLGLAAAPAAATAYARARSGTAGAPVAIAAVTVAVGFGQLSGPLVAGVSADRLGLAAVAVLAGCMYLLSAGLAVADAFTAREAAA